MMNLRLVGIWVFIGTIGYTAPLLADSPAIDRILVVDLLQNNQPINWVPYAQTDSDKRRLFTLFSEIVNSSDDLRVPLVKKAIVEAGKFASNDEANLFPEAAELYQKLVDTSLRSINGMDFRMAFVQSLQNANIPESISYLTKAIEAEDSFSAQFATETALRLIDPNPPAQPPYPNTEAYRFEPRTGTPFSSRLRKEDWLKVTQSALPIWQQSLEKSGLPPQFRDALRRLTLAAKNQIALSTGAKENDSGFGDDAMNRPKNFAANPTTSKESQTLFKESLSAHSGPSRTLWIGLLITTILGIFSFILIKIKK